MHKIVKISLALFLFSLGETSFIAQETHFATLPEHLSDQTFADWIAPSTNETGVFYFRKKLNLNEIPDSFIIHVSADARYRLYVNAKMVSWGPAIGDMENWNYETIDISPFLKAGENIVTAQVWKLKNMGARQISNRTAFILQGNNTAEHIINSNESWKVTHDKGYHSLRMTSAIVGGGYIAGSTDSVNALLHPWGWEQQKYDDSDWENAIAIGKGIHMQLDTWIGTPWKLKQRNIPSMEQTKEKVGKILYINGMNQSKHIKDQDNINVEIPANSIVEILIDKQNLTMGFPQLIVNGGVNSRIKIQYQEALFNSDGTKGNRDEWQGKTMKGYYDVFLPDGNNRIFVPLWIRVFRYIKLTIETTNDPLQILDFYNIYTAYPLKQIASFTSDNDTLKDIWDASWRTARLCALENYMDCPYYEQLQYIGDTRIQALISMYVAGDDRLARNAIQQIYGSLQPTGLTKSNHPSAGLQIIPPFSLLYISMIHDFYMLREDPEFIKQFLPGMKFILEWFISKIDTNGILGPLPYWNHIDGGTEFVNGSPPGVSEGGSAHISILLVYTLQHAIELLRAFDLNCDADRYEKIVNDLKIQIMQQCYNIEKGLMAETPNQQIYSQHTNAMAILAGLFDQDQAKSVAQKMISDTTLIQTTLYFKFYLFQALKKAGMGSEIIHQMNVWQKFLDFGLTTFPEHGIESRSDCHAWSAHPMFDFINITCGIAPGSPGFKTVEIQPDLGTLRSADCTMPHPNGTISTKYEVQKNGQIKSEIILPEGVDGTFIYEGEIVQLKSGKNNFTK